MPSTRWAIVEKLVMDLGRVCSVLQDAEAEAAHIREAARAFEIATMAKRAATDAVGVAAAGDQNTREFDVTVVAARAAIAKARETASLITLAMAESRASRLDVDVRTLMNRVRARVS
jgi:hypothetical protein